jgi:predicted secreted Zn-dependent protease
MKKPLNTTTSRVEVDMKKRTKSLLEEINSIAPVRDRTQLLESRGNNAISAVINLIEMIETEFDAETSQDLQKRIMLSIKNRDADRFIRGIKRMRNENK